MDENLDTNRPSTSAGGSPGASCSARDNLVVCAADTRSIFPRSSSRNYNLPLNLQCHPMDDIVLNNIDRFHTRKATKSALTCWNTWRFEKYKQSASSSSMVDPMMPYFYEVCSYPLEKMDEMLGLFVAGIRNKDGDEYPPDTLRGMMFGLQRYLKAFCMQNDIKPITFVKNDYQFPKYCAALKKKVEELNTMGIQTKNNQAFGMTTDEEILLWENGVLGCCSAEVLSNTVFVYIVKIFGIVSSNALRTLTTDTFVFGENEVGKYVEIDKDFANDLEVFGSASCCHNLSLCDSATKKLRHYRDPNNPRTFYNLLKFYVEVIKHTSENESFNDKEKSLLLQPLKDTNFSRNAIGRNQLQKKFAKMMNSGNFSGYFTTQALVQSVMDSLQMKGYMVRKKQSFSLEHQIQICKLLDPPIGPLNMRDFKVQTSSDVIYLSPSEIMGLPHRATCQSQMEYVLQHQQSSIPLTVVQPQASHPVSNSVEFRPVFTGTYSPALANNPVLQGFGPVSTISSLPGNSNFPQLSQQSHHIYQKDRSPKIKPENAEVDTYTDYSDKTGNESDCSSDYDFDNVIIKQEPVTHYGEDCSESESKIDVVSEYGDRDDRVTEVKSKKRRFSGLNENDIETERKSKKFTRELRKSEEMNRSQFNKIPDSTEDTERVPPEHEVHNADIEYSFTNDLDKKITKQDVCLKEDDQTIFTFSGTSKMGRSIGDLDINLGDYLPQNCTIKPEDINLKRMIFPDGGKMIIKLKYSVEK